MAGRLSVKGVDCTLLAQFAFRSIVDTDATRLDRSTVRIVDETRPGTTEPSIQRREFRLRDPAVQLWVMIQLCAAGEATTGMEAFGRDVGTG